VGKKKWYQFAFFINIFILPQERRGKNIVVGGIPARTLEKPHFRHLTADFSRSSFQMAAFSKREFSIEVLLV